MSSVRFWTEQLRILTREEVIDRTKVCLQNDVNDGTFDSYLTPATLFDGLYRPDCDRDRADGNPWLENKWWMKTTGRYPTIPLVYDLFGRYGQETSGGEGIGI